MIRYILKRLIYAIPILIGVNLITFFLFFVVNTPDDVARLHLGNKRVTQEQIITNHFYIMKWRKALMLSQIQFFMKSLSNFFYSILETQTAGETLVTT